MNTNLTGPSFPSLGELKPPSARAEPAGIDAIHDEFLQGLLFWRIQEKFRQAIAKRRSDIQFILDRALVHIGEKVDEGWERKGSVADIIIYNTADGKATAFGALVKELMMKKVYVRLNEDSEQARKTTDELQ